MRRFTQLVAGLRVAKGMADGESALADYFAEVPAEDAAWAVWLLTGGRPKRVMERGRLLELAGRAAGIPSWLVAECRSAAADECEAASLILDTARLSCEEDEMRLADLMEKGFAAAAAADLLKIWRQLSEPECLLFHKLITGSFKTGPWKKMVTTVLAGVAGVSRSVMACRLTTWTDPKPGAYQCLIKAADKGDLAAETMPFCVIKESSERDTRMELANDWMAYDLPDGIPAQLVKRSGKVFLWTEEEQFVETGLPEVIRAAKPLPKGTVLLGLLAPANNEGTEAWLRSRLIGGTNDPRQVRERAVVFRVHDVLECQGSDLRNRSTTDRMALLAELLAGCGQDSSAGAVQGDLFLEPTIQVNETEGIAAEPMIEFSTWDEIEDRIDRKGRRVLLKRRAAGYCEDDWYLWKPEPFRFCAVLIAVRPEMQDVSYTFAVWCGVELLSVGSITGPAAPEVDEFVRNKTVQRRGPVRELEPELVFELECEGIAASSRHQSGFVLRSPGIVGQRTEMEASAAVSIEQLKELVRY